MVQGRVTNFQGLEGRANTSSASFGIKPTSAVEIETIALEILYIKKMPMFKYNNLVR
jgi:hypothetical protein